MTTQGYAVNLHVCKTDFQRKQCNHSSLHDRVLRETKISSIHAQKLQQSTSGIPVLNCIGRNWLIHSIALSPANSPTTCHEVASVAEKQRLCFHLFMSAVTALQPRRRWDGVELENEDGYLINFHPQVTQAMKEPRGQTQLLPSRSEPLDPADSSQ